MSMRLCFGKKMVQRVVAAVALASLVLFAGSPVFSQSSQGSIRVAVTDQTGGVIAGASVTVTDTARGITQTFVTGAAGEYVANNLTPGNYTVRAEVKGFQAVEHSGVLVQVGQTIPVDLIVQPGEQTQTVTVTEEIPLLNTVDSVMGGTVSNQSISELPLNGRNFERLLDLRPGTVSAPGSGTGSSNTNGRRIANNSFRVEGIMQVSNTTGSSIMNASYRGGDSGSLLPIDAIQEFSEQQNPKAENGFRDGSVVNVGIKSGTNSIHGTAYAFGRDASATDAANFFTGQATPANFEQFGASAGGPIIKDKFFWFANYEGIRDTTGNTGTTTTPTWIPGAGAANSLVDACASLAGKVNPLSAQLAGIVNFTNPALANYCVPQPANFTAGGVENIFPVNNTSSTTYFQDGATILPLNNGIFKADYALNSHHHLNGLFYISKSVSHNLGASQLLPSYWTGGNNNIQQYSGDWTWIPDGLWANDLRAGFVFNQNQTFAGDAGMLPQNPWPTGYGMPTGVTNPLYGGLPTISIRSFTGVAGANARTSQGGRSGDFNLVDGVSTLRGKHSLKFGFEFVDMLHNPNNFSGASGAITFTTLATFLSGTPQSGSIALGSPAASYRARLFAGYAQDDWRLTSRVTLNLGLRYDFYGAPFEKNNYLGTFDPTVNPATTPAAQLVGPGTGRSLFKTGAGYLEPRVGMAWDLRGDGKTVVRMGAGLFSVGWGMETPVSFTPFGANFPSIAGYSANPTLQAHTFANYTLVPAQIAWNTAANQAGCNTIFPNVSCPVAINGVNYTGITCTYPGEAGLPAGYTPTPCQTGGLNPNWKQAKSVQWNLDIQRAITKNLTVGIAYVGNHGYDESMMVDLNQPAVGTGWNTPWTAQQLATQTSATKIPNVAGNVGLTSAQICANTNTCLPNLAAELAAEPYGAQFPYLSQIDQGTYGAFSNYNALQATLQGRNYHGLTLLAGYTYAHSLATTDGNFTIIQNTLPSDKNNTRANYGNTTYDLRHRFTFSPSYQIPGRKAPGQMLEGWSVNAILTLQPGLHSTIADLTNTDWLGTGEITNTARGNGAFQYWNYVGPTNAFAHNATAFVTNPTTVDPAVFTKLTGAAATGNATCLADAQAPYAGDAQLMGVAKAALFNSGCYLSNGGVLTAPAYGTLGNAGHGFFVGPNYRNVDFSVSKLWKVKERYSAQFRLEFFNLLNRVNFGAPGSDPTKAAFGSSNGTPDSANAVLGSGGARHIQFGLKLAF